MVDLVAFPGVPQSAATETNHRGWSAATARSSGSAAHLQEDVRQLVGSSWVEEIEIRADDPFQIQAAVDAGRLVGRRVSLASPLHQSALPAPLPGERWVKEDQAWVLVPPQRSRAELALKRLIDLILSATLLILLLPLLLATAIAVLLTSGGPILYAWRVLGENGRPFVGYKFRTMVRDADAMKLQLLHLNERTGPVFKMAEDPRVTSLGRWLRKYSLDELPQLWSVLVGDMSLVGPRPVFSSEYQKCELWQMRKLSVKPGLTCLWQVEGRQTVTDFSDWARLDLRYIDNWSLWSDAAILFRTPVAIVRGTGH